MNASQEEKKCLIEDILIKRTYTILDNNLNVATAFQLWNWDFVSVSEFWPWKVLKISFSFCFETEDIQMVAVFHSTEDSPRVWFSMSLGKVLNQNVNKMIQPTPYSLLYAVISPQGITLTNKLAAVI